MRSILIAFVIVGLLAMIVLAAGHRVVTEYFSSSTTSSIVQAGKDTTNGFYALLRDGQGDAGKYAPSGASVYWKTTETNDSTWVSLTLQVSPDNSRWVTHTVLDTIITEDGAGQVNVSSVPVEPYWRYIVTGAMASGDTVVVGPIKTSLKY